MSIFIIASLYSIFTLTIGLIIMGLILPAIWREGNVKNGLQGYRRIFLTSGVSIFVLTLIALCIISTRFFLSLETYKIFSYINLMLFSTIVLIITVAKYKMYTFQFTPENKDFHALIEDLEQGRAKIIRVKKGGKK